MRSKTSIVRSITLKILQPCRKKEEFLYMKTWKKWLKRIASTVCAAAMCAAMLPATAFAEGPETFEEKAPEPEPQYTITSFTKERVIEAPENGTDGFFHASLLDDGTDF